MLDYNAAYGMIMGLQTELKVAMQNYPPYLDGPDYKTVQALAATYELQEFLANAIARAEERKGELEEEEA